ncbi:MAG: DUF6596 domain-containing protein [Myxococcota bacterium]
MSRHAVEMAARDSYGRLLAWLVSRCRDIALAEDVLADALEAALLSWPEKGVPENPEAWLLTVARRKLIDQQRRAATRTAGSAELEFVAQARLQREAAEATDTPFRTALPDRRLELMFVCAHPEIPREMRTPLMLQAVLGLTAERIAATMLVQPSTMGQRLVRTKRKITDLGVSFDLPEGAELSDRLFHVLEAIYAAYGSGQAADSETGEGDSGLAHEAFWLARILVELLPDAAEAKGLYALLCFCESRRDARRSESGEYVPLEEQDTNRWDHELILEGEKALWLASKRRDGGPFQTEAAIHSVHAHRARSGRTDWEGIYRLYEVLTGLFPSLGAYIGKAASCGRTGRAGEGMAILDALPAKQTERHQPYWAVRAWLLSTLDRYAEAKAAYERAIGLCLDPAVRRWLLRRAERLSTEAKK